MHIQCHGWIAWFRYTQINIATNDPQTSVEPSNVEPIRATLLEMDLTDAFRLGEADQQGTAVVLLG